MVVEYNRIVVVFVVVEYNEIVVVLVVVVVVKYLESVIFLYRSMTSLTRPLCILIEGTHFLQGNPKGTHTELKRNPATRIKMTFYKEEEEEEEKEGKQ